jgi:hypothetical protein
LVAGRTALDRLVNFFLAFVAILKLALANFYADSGAQIKEICLLFPYDVIAYNERTEMTSHAEVIDGYQ